MKEQGIVKKLNNYWLRQRYSLFSVYDEAANCVCTALQLITCSVYRQTLLCSKY